MRVTLLVPTVPADDPADGAGALATGLAALGHDVVVAVTAQRPPAPVQLGGARAVAVEDALAIEADVAIAATWDATARLFEIPAARHVMWVEELGYERLGAWQAERIAALIAYDLPVDFVAAAQWVREALAQRRPDARVLLARKGASKATSARADDRGRPLRVLADDRFHDGGDDATAGPAETLLGATRFAGHALASGATAGERAAALASADVLVMLDPSGSALGSPLEALHAGAVPLVLPAGARDELVRHLETGIVADPEDERGALRWLERLDADRDLLARLRAAGAEAVASWPSPEQAAIEAQAALEQIASEPAPDAARWPVRLMADAMAGVAVYRQDHFELAGELRRVQSDEAYLAAQRVRERLRDERLAPIRRAAARLARGRAR